MTTLTVTQVRRRYLLLHGLRWLPVGLAMPVYVLLMMDRGLSLSQVGWMAAAMGTTALVLEVPTGGLADALGRRPILIMSKAVHFAALTTMALADDFTLFLIAGVLYGAFRALDSGPLDAWYVDAVLEADPQARIVGGLSGAGVVLGGAIAAGSLASSGLVVWNPVPALGALALPLVVAAALELAGVIAVATLVAEARPDNETDLTAPRGIAGARRAAALEVRRLIGEALRLLRRSRLLLALLVAELLWAVGSPTFETLMPPRLSEIMGDSQTAAALMGPAGTAAWVVSAIGAGLAPLTSRSLGVPLAAALLRLTQGGTVVAMGMLAGPIGVIAAYVGTYVIHGAANPLHQTLLHREVDGPYRATVLSLNSLMAQPGLIIGSIVLTVLADATSITVAMIVGALVMASAAPLYLVRRRSRTLPPQRQALAGSAGFSGYRSRR